MEYHSLVVRPSARRPGRALQLLAALSLALVVPVVSAQIAFTDVSGKVAHRGESYGAAWGDFNGDGYLDLFASNHREQPSLFLNRGGDTFIDTATQIREWVWHAGADTHGGTWQDFDNDGDQDLIISTGNGNYMQLLVNENQRMVYRSDTRGLANAKFGGRLPVWFDYDGDKRADVVLANFSAAAPVFKQDWQGNFVNTTSDTKFVCAQMQYMQLFDVTNDGRLDLLCPTEAVTPQKIWDAEPFPWLKLFDYRSSNNQVNFPFVKQTADSVIADFNNDGRMDMFVLGGTQVRQSSVALSGTDHIEARLTGGIKGFKFVTSGTVTFDPRWNKLDEGSPQDLSKIKIGTTGWSPTTFKFTLSPSDSSVVGMPQAPAQLTDLPVIHIGFDPVAKRWTVKHWTKYSATSGNVYSDAYILVDTESAVSGLASTGLWPSDFAATPTLLMNYSGGMSNQTAAANLDAPVQCVSATAGDYDNDMDVDLYLACRTGVSNIANILYSNNGNGTFTRVAGAGGASGPEGIAYLDGVNGLGTADSAITGDYDVDGFLDLFVTNGLNLQPYKSGGPNKLFRNNGNSNHWVEVDLIGTNSERDAVGARVIARAGGVNQYRVQNGAYHRWSQDAKRSHFGLGGATTVDITVEWPNSPAKTYSGLAADRLYRITEGDATPEPVTLSTNLGKAPPFQCGAPSINSGVDVGVFVWRDCPTGQWRIKTSAGGQSFTYKATIKSDAAYTGVQPQGNEADDVLSQPDAQTITFTFNTSGNFTDGVNFTPKDGARNCMNVYAPTGTQVYYGPFRAKVASSFDLETKVACTP